MAANTLLVGGVDRYAITVTCAPGANPPQNITCNTPENLETITNLTLSGLTNFSPYTISLTAYRDETIVAASLPHIAFPTDIFVYLPMIRR